jgi:hypothetical protein
MSDEDESIKARRVRPTVPWRDEMFEDVPPPPPPPKKESGGQTEKTDGD